MIKHIMKRILNKPKFESFDSYLFVGPHPDDIEVACGATVAKLVAMGKRVVFVVATDGRGATILDTPLTEQEIVALRQQEARQSAHVLGVDNVIFLPFADGGMYDYHQLVISLQRVIVQQQVDMVITTDHTTISECHADHILVGKATTHAFMNSAWHNLNNAVGIQGRGCCKAIAYYHTNRPNKYVAIGKYLAIKHQSLCCHKSQFSASDLATIKLYGKLRSTRYAFVSGKGKVDAYRMLTAQAAHCIPEMS